MPAAAVIRRGQALSGFTGCKGSVDGVGEQVAARSNGDVAQLGEHLPCKQGVESSNLFISTEIGRFQDGLIAQLVRAHA